MLELIPNQFQLVCAGERERETEREGGRERERETTKEMIQRGRTS